MSIFSTNVTLVDGAFQIAQIEDFKSSTEPFLRFATQEKLSEDCIICMDTLVDRNGTSVEVSFLKCGHFLHTTCFNKHIDMISHTGVKNCPYCRFVLNKRSIDYLIDAISAENEEDTILALKGINTDDEVQSLEFLNHPNSIICASWLKSPNKILARTFLQVFGAIVNFWRKNSESPIENCIRHILNALSPFDFLKILEYEVRNNLELSLKIFYNVLECFYESFDKLALFRGSDSDIPEEANKNRKNLRYITIRVSRLLDEYSTRNILNQDYISCLVGIKHLQMSDLECFLHNQLFTKIIHSLEKCIIPDKRDTDLFKSFFNDFDIYSLSNDYYILSRYLYSDVDFFSKCFNLEIRPPRESSLFERWRYFVSTVLEVFKMFILRGQFEELKFPFDLSYIECFTPVPDTCFSFIEWWLKHTQKGYFDKFIDTESKSTIIDKIKSILRNVDDDKYIKKSILKDVQKEIGAIYDKRSKEMIQDDLYLELNDNDY